MKNLCILLILGAVLTSCTVTIPMQTNLSDQTMLLAENRNIKANYTIYSDVPDGFINYVSATKNGNETVNNEAYKYASTTAFSKLWDSYFASKFNGYSKDEMDIEVVLKKLQFKEQASTSVGMTMLTGNIKQNVEAIASVYVLVTYHGEKYENQFDVSASDYNESQQMKAGNTYYTVNQTNPTQQKSMLLDACLNKTIVQFENFLRSVMMADLEGK